MAKIVRNAVFFNSEFLEPTTFLFGASRNSKNLQARIRKSYRMPQRVLPALLPLLNFSSEIYGIFSFLKANFDPFLRSENLKERQH